MGTVAKALGWDQSKTMEAARSVKYGAHKNSTCLGQYCEALGTDYIGLSRKFKNSTRMPWAATLPPRIKEAIRRQNYVDVELVAFAKQLLFHRHGINCDSEEQELKEEQKLEERSREEEQTLQKQKLAEQKLREQEQQTQMLEERKLEGKQELQEQKLQDQKPKAAEAARAACEHIAYIGPQRTAGVTLVRNILPSNAAANNQTLHALLHMEYYWANATAPNCIIASLRDPVERFLSEYSVFKANSVEIFEHTDWDIHANDLPWLREVHAKTFLEGLKDYMSSPANPTDWDIH